jgi:hypothetical protein
MDTRVWWVALALVPIGGLLACSADLAVPEGAQIGCAAAADCPTGFTCNAKIGRCVKTESIDSTAPALVSEVTVTPAVLKKGAKATVSFSVSEDLSTPPVVTLSAGTDRLLTYDSRLTTHGSGKYEFTYAAVGDEPQGVESAISIVLTDKSGNESGKLSGKSLKFDFVAPGVVGTPVVKGSPSGEKGTPAVSFTVTEALAAAPEVKLKSGAEWSMEPGKTPPEYEFTYSPKADDPQDPEGTEITVTLVDEAQNEAKDLLLGAVVFDFVRPAVVGELAVDPPVAKAGRTVSIGFTVSEKLGAGWPVVKVDGTALANVEPRGMVYMFGYLVTDGDADGEHAVTVEMSDEAGNAGAAPFTGAFRVDNTAPQVTNVTTAGKRYSAQPGFDEVKATFDCTEDVGEGLDATVGGLPMSCGGWQPGPPNYTCTYAVTGAEGGGIKEVVVSATDRAGNAGFGSASVEFDFAGPVLVMAVNPSGRAARLGETLTVGVTGSEELAAGGVLLESGGLNLGQPLVSGTSYTWMRTVAAGEEGVYALSAMATDVTGNLSAAVATGSVTLDGVVPVISGVKAWPSRVTAGGVFRVSFKASEPLGADPVGTFSNGVDAPVGMAKVQAEAGYDYTFEGTAPSSGSVPFYTVKVVVEDRAGNQGMYSPVTVEIDNVAPELAGLEVAPAGAKLNDTLRAVLSATETMSGPPVLVAKSGGSTITFNPVDATPGKVSYAYTHAVTGGTVQGVYTVQPFDMADVAGNTKTGVTPSPAVTFSVDSSVPVVSGVAADRAKYSRVAGYDHVTVTFNCSEDVGAGLSIKVGGVAMTCDPYQSAVPNYKCTYTIQPGDTAGVKDINVQATDSAGNSGFGSGSVEYDFAAASAISAGPSAGAYKLNDGILYTINVSEPLGGSPGRPAIHVFKGAVEQPNFFGNPVSETDTSFTYAKTVAAGMDGTYTVQIDLTDKAGNSAAGQNGTGWGVDASVPAMATGPTLNKSPANYKAGDTISVSFTTSEDLDATLPKATLNTTTTKDLPCVAGGGTNDYTCALSAPLGGTETPQGQVGISIQLQDAAGNTGFASTNVTVDFTNPAVISATPGQAAYKLNDGILYTVNVSEPLSGSPGRPAVHVFKDAVEQPNFLGNPIYETDTSFTYAKTVTEGMDGAYIVKVDLADKAGNAVADLAADGFAVDATPPVVTEQSLLTNNSGSSVLARNGDVVTAVFMANEDPSQNPSVALGGKAMAFVSKTGTGPYTFTYNRTAATADGDGLKGVTVTASDLAGNVAVFSFASGVTYDFTPPGVGTASVRFIPGATCSLTSVSKVGVGNTAKVSFTVNEPLSADPVFSGLIGTWTVTKASGSSLGLYYEYDLTLTAGNGEWSQTPKVTLVDVAGNAGVPVDLAGVTITADAAAPAAPDVNTQDRIVYKRVPWGFDENRNGVFVPKTFRVIGGAGAVDTGTAWVLSYDGPDPATAAEIGRKAAAGGTFGTMDLNRADRLDVYVAAFDAACNRSAAVKVKDVDLVVTMGGKVAGSTYENPNVYETRRRFNQYVLVQDEDSAESEGGPLAAVSDGSMLSTLGTSRWFDRSFNNTPSSRYRHSMTWDFTRGRVVLFGGSIMSGANGETWVWTGTGWWLAASGGPSARYGHAMAYDANRGGVLLFGGHDGMAYSAETWLWDGADWNLVATLGPSARAFHSMAYAQDRRRVVLFGGTDGADKGDTWEWDGAEWLLVSSTGPSARSEHAMAYDMNRQRTVLFGGTAGGDETWVWSGTAWSRVMISGPSARRGIAMTYDLARSKLLVFGGTAGGDTMGDVWEWDGDTAHNWVQAGTTGLYGRSHSAMAFDPVNNHTVLMGGSYSGIMMSCLGDQLFDAGICGGTFVWNGTAWSMVYDPNNKPATQTGVTGYDVAHDRTWLQGCYYSPSLLCQEWEWARHGWRTYESNGPEHGDSSLAYDASRSRFVLFGGTTSGNCDGCPSQFCCATWEWTGESTASWQKVTMAGPAGRTYAALAFDSARNRTVLFGGTTTGINYADTWVWNGSSWTNGTMVVSPEARNGHSMVFDAPRGKVVIFGGYNLPYSQGGGTCFGDTWEWDGDLTHDWVRVATTGPVARMNAAMIYDAASRRTMMFGGKNADFTAFKDAWEWNGTTWTQLALASPSPDGGSLLAYDSLRGTGLMLRGNKGIGTGVWEWNGGGRNGAAQVMSVPFASMLDLAEVTLKGVRLEAYAGGVGYPNGVTTYGIDVLLWDKGMWQEVATDGAANPASPKLVTWSTSADPYWGSLGQVEFNEKVRRLLVGPEMMLNFAIAPSAPNGGTSGADRYGRAAVDYLEMVVQYRQ